MGHLFQEERNVSHSVIKTDERKKNTATRRSGSPNTPFSKATGDFRSQRDIVVLLGESRFGFVLERSKEGGDSFPCIPRADDLFDDPEAGGKIGVVELLLVGGGPVRPVLPPDRQPRRSRGGR